MKYWWKKVSIYVYSLILLLGILLIAAIENSPLPCFYIQDPQTSAKEKITLYDAGDQNYWVFLPSYAETEQVTVSLNTWNRISIGDIAVRNGMTCDCFALNSPYKYSVNGIETATVWFCRSENVATMYVHTSSGDMERIQADKDREGTASVTLYTPEGTVDCRDKNSTLKGRGNSTWEYEKHPFSLVLSADRSLLGMGEAASWVLLANAHDETNLNNKLVLDLAARVGLPWTPDSRWVDLYLNGEYNGLYLLTEKVEVHENRLNIDTGSGDFLCKVDYLRRWETLRHPFVSETGHAVEISYPKIITEGEHDTVRQLVGQMEEALLSGEDLRSSSLIDLDSWIRRYLIDEISGNADSELASSYFYWSNGKFYAGPLWDYDLTFGNHYRNQEPVAFIAKNFQKADEAFSPYYHALYDNEFVYPMIPELYRSEFRPIVAQWIDCEIDSYAAQICQASRMNSIRWRDMFYGIQCSVPQCVYTTEGLKEYLSRRIQFLDNAWLENIPYCTVQFKVSEYSYWNLSVEQGSCLETAYMDTESTVWIDKATGEAFDFSRPVMADTILFRQPKEQPPQDAPSSGSGGITVFLSMGVLLFFLVILIIVDSAHTRKQRHRITDTVK